MDVNVKARLGKQLYYTEVTAGNNTLITDEPTDLGGGDKGFNPFEILATSLASCTAATLKMYMDRKQWEVDEIVVDVEVIREAERTVFNRKVSFVGGNLTEDENKRLKIIADKCPVHKALMGDVVVNTEF